MVFGVGITMILFAAAVVMPVFGLVSLFLLPLPVLVYRLKLGRSKGIAVAAVAFIAMAVILGGGSLDLFLFLGLLLLGLILGESFERRFSLEKTMVVACGGLGLLGFLALFFYSHMSGVGMQALVSGFVSQYLTMYQTAIDQMSTTEEARQALLANIDRIEFVMLRMLPGMVISGVLFTSWITVLLAKPLLKRAGLPCPDFGALIRWKAPEKLVWVLIGCGLMLMMPASGLKFIGLNGLMVLMQVYFFQGIAIVAFFFEKKRMPVLLRWFLYTLITFQIFLLVLVIAVGLFDMWLDVRKLTPKALPPEEQ
jgi:uncharacterized protein YybS (DUF2232 family)